MPPKIPERLKTSERPQSATPPDPSTVPVLIIGGSLVGLSAAVFLGWHGVPTVVVEKHRGSSLHPRAIGFTTRSIEHFRQVGVELPGSPQNRRTQDRQTQNRQPASRQAPRRARVRSLAGEWFEEYPWSPADKNAAAADDSPVHATAITQDRLEPLLRERAVELGADLRLGTEVVGLSQDVDGVSVTLRSRDGGEEHDVRARYVVAADGGASPAREAAGIGRHGRGHLSVQRSILFRAPLDDYLAHGVVQFEIDQPDFTAFLTTYSDGRWVLMLSDDVDMDADEQRQTVQKAIGRTDLPIDLITTGRWDLAALVADSFAAGRVFLAGDAAHQLPPNRGGFGANTGIDDAHNLAWKLAAVLSGESAPQLLDTYDAERRPVADLRHDQIFARADFKAHVETSTSDTPILDDSALELGQLYRSAGIAGAEVDLPPARRPDQWVGQPGTRAPHLWVKVDGETVSTLDLFGRPWTLMFEDPRWDAAIEATRSLGVPVTAVHLGVDAVPADTETYRSAYGVGSTGAVLVRPDGYIAWRTHDAPYDVERALSDALATAALPTGNDASSANAT